MNWSALNGSAWLWVALALVVVPLITVVLVTLRSLRRARADAGVHAETDATLATVGQLLLAKVDETAIVDVLNVLVSSSGAVAAFVGENSGDPGTGPIAVVKQVTVLPDADSSTIVWKLPYLQHQELAWSLSVGAPTSIDQAMAMILERPASELNAVAVPIQVSGEWAGFVGLAHDRSSGVEPAIGILESVGVMLGSFIEKRDAYSHLVDTLESRDRFLAGVSHEIRTPLTSVLGFTAFLRDEVDGLSPDEIREMIGLIDHQAREVADLVEDLLIAARSEVGGIVVDVESVELAAQVDDVIRSRVDLGNKKIVVGVSPDHIVYADAVRVRQILRNLVSNVIRYGGDEVTITSHREAGDVVLMFSDNGAGVPPELGRKIFDPYHRGSGPTKVESVGLGLTVSRQLARLMDGDLRLRTDLGPATFQLTLPSAPVPVDVVDDLAKLNV